MSATTTASSSLPSLPAVSSYSFLHLGSGCVVCSESIIEGPHDIHLGAGCIVHPRARICARDGPITLGANCVVEEHALICTDGNSNSGEPAGTDSAHDSGSDVSNDSAPSKRDRPLAVPLTLGNSNVFRIGCIVEGDVGDDSIIDVRSRVCYGASVGSDCVIGPTVQILSGTHIADRTAVRRIGSQQTQRRTSVTPASTASEDRKAKDMLREMLANTHRTLQ